MLKFSKYCYYDFYFTTSNYYSFLQDIVLFERYLRRRFNYFTSIKVDAGGVKRQKKIVILKSPFAHKKAQEHFVLQHFTKKIRVVPIFKFFNYIIFLQFFKFFKKVLRKFGSSFKVVYLFTFKKHGSKRI